MFCILIFVKRLPVSSRVWSNRCHQHLIESYRRTGCDCVWAFLPLGDHQHTAAGLDKSQWSHCWLKNQLDYILKPLLLTYMLQAQESKHVIMKPTGIIYDDSMTQHVCLWDSTYPECPERYSRVLQRYSQISQNYFRTFWQMRRNCCIYFHQRQLGKVEIKECLA